MKEPNKILKTEYQYLLSRFHNQGYWFYMFLHNHYNHKSETHKTNHTLVDLSELCYQCVLPAVLLDPKYKYN